MMMIPVHIHFPEKHVLSNDTRYFAGRGGYDGRCDSNCSVFQGADCG